MPSHSDRPAFPLLLRLPALLAACATLAACASRPTTTGSDGSSASMPSASIASGATEGAASADSATPVATRANASERAVRPVETFDMVWTTVRDNHFDKELNGVDWIAIREELRPKAVAISTQDELRAVLLDMLGRLGQSHFTIIPGDVAEESPVIDSPREQVRAPEDDASTAASTDASSGDDGASPAPSNAGPGVSGLDIALVEGEATVLRVKESSPAAAAGVRPGWTVVAVGSHRIADQLAAMRAALAREEQSSPDSPHARQLRTELAIAGEAAFRAPAGASLPVTFGTPEGERTIDVAFLPAPYGAPEFGNLPALPIEVDSRILEIPASGKPIRVGVISFNIWLTGASRAIDEAVDGLRSCDGIVIDLRGNPGGLGVMSTGVAGHFLAEPASLGSMIGRDNTLQFNALPRKVSTAGKRVRPYARPLAILVDARSASTSEVFAGGLQDLGRARVFGETSAGMALPAQAIELPNGDVLMHAVADFVTGKGTRLEGRGVVPDEVAVPSRAALLDGNDAALDAAKRWIGERTLASRAAKAGPSPVEAVQVPTSAPPPAQP